MAASQLLIMIVCVCKSVSDRAIRAKLTAGVNSFVELQVELGVATCCGKCAESVQDLMLESGVCATRCGVDYPLRQAKVAAAHAATSPVAVPLTFYEREAA
jgi:bacterioferritin-associated ferredoxin